MSSTRITLTPALRARAAQGHSASGPPVKNWKSDALQGDGALFSSANDMLKFLAANMGKSPSALATAMEKTHRPQRDADPSNKVGLGWHTVSAGGEGGAVWHNGQTGGFHAYIAFNPQRRRGVVVLANSANSIDLLGAYVLGETDTLDDPTVPTQRRTTRVDQAALDRCVGRYKGSEPDVITVTRDGERLIIQPGAGPRAQALPESETSFFCTAIDAQITFEKNAAGEVTRAVLRHEGKDETAEKLSK
jgi:CubicO group peptidase (beta-lactamase class C family)